MIAIRIEPHQSELRKRRSEISKTLQYLEEQLRELEENKEWIDGAAYLSRCRLLDSLADWYNNETTRIDNALLRINKDNLESA